MNSVKSIEFDTVGDSRGLRVLASPRHTGCIGLQSEGPRLRESLGNGNGREPGTGAEIGGAAACAESLEGPGNCGEPLLHEQVPVIGLRDPLGRVECFWWVITVRDAFAALECSEHAGH